MKTLRLFSLFTCMILLGMNTNLFSQDVIFLSNGNEINAKIIKIGDSEIEYKKWNNQEGPIYTEKKSNIFMIKYQNGEKDIFEHNMNNNRNNTNINEANKANLSNNLITYADYDKVFYKGKRISNDELEHLLKTNCMAAYEQYASGKHKRNAAITLRSIAFVFLAASLPLYLSDDYDLMIIASGLDITGTAMMITSFPLGGVGKNQMKDSFDTYNSNIKNNNNISLNFGACSSGGIGFSLKF